LSVITTLPDRDADRFIAQILANGLWHTTSLARFESIRKCGAIQVEPEIPDSERHKTLNGPRNHPYVRSVKGVSLFDFSDFQSCKYQKSYPSSSYHFFVPICQQWSEAVWIEIDRDQTTANFISGQDLLRRWKCENAYGHTIMPIIEAAHTGDISAACFKRALMVTTDGDGLTIDTIELN
jgi:hypothetical protein